MISKNKIKTIQATDSRKEREKSGLFIVEGNKSVAEFLDYFDCELLVAEPEWLESNNRKIKGSTEVIEVTHDELRRASLLKNPQNVLALFRQRKEKLNTKDLENQLSIYLDCIQDPGNLGTIIRAADWFGIRNIICSNTTADVYNPKTVQATMGALCRVHLHYVDGEEFFSSLPKGLPVYGTFLEGDNIYKKDLKENGIIVMGNEGNGISDTIKKFVTDKLFIPSYPPGEATSESLNVAIATAITCAEFRRRIF